MANNASVNDALSASEAGVASERGYPPLQAASSVVVDGDGETEFRGLSPLDFSAIIQHADTICPGVGQRVSGADFSAIVTAVVKVVQPLHSPKTRRVRMDPPPSYLGEAAKAMRVLTQSLTSGRAIAQPAVKQAKAPPARAAGGKARMTPNAPGSSSSARRAGKGQPKPSPTTKSSSEAPEIGRKGTKSKESSSVPSLAKRRERLLEKALRSFKGLIPDDISPAMKLKRLTLLKPGVCPENLKSQINRMTAEQLDALDRTIPPLVALGLCDSSSPDWGEEVEREEGLLEWCKQARAAGKAAGKKRQLRQVKLENGARGANLVSDSNDALFAHRGAHFKEAGEFAAAIHHRISGVIDSMNSQERKFIFGEDISPVRDTDRLFVDPSRGANGFNRISLSRRDRDGSKSYGCDLRLAMLEGPRKRKDKYIVQVLPVGGLADDLKWSDSKLPSDARVVTDSWYLYPPRARSVERRAGGAVGRTGTSKSPARQSPELSGSANGSPGRSYAAALGSRPPSPLPQAARGGSPIPP